jgi:hypothetical protein
MILVALAVSASKLVTNSLVGIDSSALPNPAPFVAAARPRGSGKVEIKDLVVSKSITKESRDYQKAGITAIAMQQLLGNGVKLRSSQNVEYIITDNQSSVRNDRVRAIALWEAWFDCGREKYDAVLREGFEPFGHCAPQIVDIKCLNESFSDERLKRFPLFAPLAPLRS